MRLRRLLPILALGAFLAAPAALAEGPPEIIRLQGNDIPQYHLVSLFFQQALALYEIEGEEGIFYQRYLEKLGLEPGSSPAQAFTDSLREFERQQPTEAQKLTRQEELLALADDEGAYGRRQQEIQVAEAARLGSLYHQLELELQHRGSSLSGIESYVTQQLAKNAQLTSDKPLGSRFWSAVQAFNSYRSDP